MRFALRHAAQSFPHVAGRLSQLPQSSLFIKSSSRLATLSVDPHLHQYRAFTVHRQLREKPREQSRDEERLSQFKESCK